MSVSIFAAGLILGCLLYAAIAILSGWQRAKHIEQRHDWDTFTWTEDE